MGVSSSSSPVPAGSGVLRNLVFSPSRDAAPWLQVSVDWFNFLGRAEAAGLSSLHFLTPFTQLWRPDFVCYMKNSVERKGGVAIGVYWFFCVKINSLREQKSIKRPAVRLKPGPCTLTPPLMLLKEISAPSEDSHIWILFGVLTVHFHKADFASSCLEVSVWSVLIRPLPSDNLSWLTAASRFPENGRGQMG